MTDFEKYYSQQVQNDIPIFYGNAYMKGYGIGDNGLDFNKYYLDQANGDTFPIYHGNPYMRGYGFGSVFRRLFRWIVPIIKENALPVVKNIGKEAVKSAFNIANDTIEGKSFVESAKTNLKQSLNDLSKQFGGSLTVEGKKKQGDKIAKYRKKNAKIKKKRKIDIFD
jgi:hypothetical protein